MASFATLAEFNALTGMNVDSTRGTPMLEHASALIRLATDQDLEATTGRQEEWAADDTMYEIFVTQRPVTALTMTVDAVAFTDFDADYMTGKITRTDDGAWSEGPILITYDSGYAADSDQIAAVKGICIEAAARALGGPQETFGLDVPELRGAPTNLFLTREETQLLANFGPVGVG